MNDTEIKKETARKAMKQWYKKHIKYRKEFDKKYYIKNKDKIKLIHKKYYLKNKKRMNHLNKQYRLKNKEKIRKWKRKYERNMWKTSLDYRLKKNLRRRIIIALKGKRKSTKTFMLLKMDLLTLKKHLEKQFKPGMTWKNYGSKWHIDHIRPCSSFNLTNKKEQQLCFHYSNLQPLWAYENILKGDKY